MTDKIKTSDCPVCLDHPEQHHGDNSEWNFLASAKGAASSAIVYRLIETVNENGLDGYKYLKYLFEVLSNLPFKDEPELLQAYKKTLSAV